jgi:uncharacterized membrane protein
MVYTKNIINKAMFIKIYAIAISLFFLIDMIWLGLIAKNFYKSQIGFLMKTNINWAAAIIFYFIFVLGLVIFVIIPSIQKDSFTNALFLGAFFGFVCYATYDLTNLAVTKDWPFLVTIVDLFWGALISASVSVITYFIAKIIPL